MGKENDSLLNPGCKDTCTYLWTYNYL